MPTCVEPIVDDPVMMLMERNDGSEDSKWREVLVVRGAECRYFDLIYGVSAYHEACQLIVKARGAQRQSRSRRGKGKFGALDNFQPSSMCVRLLSRPRCLAEWITIRCSAGSPRGSVSSSLNIVLLSWCI